jgi:hypothetical protein
MMTKPMQRIAEPGLCAIVTSLVVFSTCALDGARLHVGELQMNAANRAAFSRGQCLTLESTSSEPEQVTAATAASQHSLRVFRIAVAASGEYTQFHGGTVAGARAAIETTLEAVNEIYERELGIRLVVVPDNDRLIFLDPATDPYTFNNASLTTLRENQRITDELIGPDNYDLGIVFNTGKNGLAYIRNVCVDGLKASACIGSATPAGYDFDVGLVAHEIAHQFGANHTFNSTLGECAGNRHGWTAFEPGSGTTLMSYAGLDCEMDRLQEQVDPYFHAKSIEEIRNFVGSLSCGESIPIDNGSPILEPPRNYTIPARTPFVLKAAATDPDGDSLTYCWEQLDTGPAQSLGDPDNGQSALFRSFPPSDNPERFFPSLGYLITGEISPAETLPSMERLMRFRVTVRDGKIGRGAVAWGQAVIAVTTNSGPFRVTAPETGAHVHGSITVRWDVAGTANPPVQAGQVNLMLSLDGGWSYPITLASGTPNDGEETLVLPPEISTASARVKVQAADNVFFAISPGDFAIGFPPHEPILATIQVMDGATLLRWNSVPGASYQVQLSTALNETWVDFGEPVRAASESAELLLPNGSVHSFYRIRWTGSAD